MIRVINGQLIAPTEVLDLTFTSLSTTLKEHLDSLGLTPIIQGNYFRVPYELSDLNNIVRDLKQDFVPLGYILGGSDFTIEPTNQVWILSHSEWLDFDSKSLVFKEIIEE